MSTVDFPDVDSFGILEASESLPDPASEPTPNVPQDEASPHRPLMAVAGNSNETAGRDIIKIETVVFREEVAELARARSEKRAGRGLQDPEALQHLADRYVPPPGLLGESPEGEPETAFQILHRRRVLLLAAEEHDGGQFAAGLRLGYELRKKHPDLVVREELIDQLQADELLVDNEPAVVLGDLRGSADGLQAVRRGLVEFANNLQSYQSYLILIIPYEQVRTFNELFPGRGHLLGKPLSIQVFARCLTEVDAHSLIRGTDFAERLERLWPPKVKELADAVSDRIKRHEDPGQALHRVLSNQLQGWTPDLREDIRRKQEDGESDWLALLLAAAVLEGAAAKHIVQAADQMLALNRLAREQPVPLLRPSPYTRLLSLAGDRFNPETREFQPRGCGTRVLQHFWREHPDLHAEMLRWIGDLPRQIRDLKREELELIADRTAELAAEGGYLVAVALAQQWSRTKKGTDSNGTQTSNYASDRYRRSIAVRLLTTTATDTSLGRETRQKLGEWARDSNADLQLLTAEVCAGIGQSFPRIALTRLKHLASTQDEHVRASVLAAVRQIGIDLPISRLLRYLSEWFDSATPARLHLLSEAVATVLAEQTGTVDTDAAASFWNRALDKMPTEDLRPVVESWLRTAAATSSDQRDAMVEPLVQATKSESLRIAQLQYASRFSRTPPDLSSLGTDAVTDVVHRLWTRLDEVDPVWQ